MKKSSLSVWRLIIVSFLVVLTLSPVSVSSWNLKNGEIISASILPDADWKTIHPEKNIRVIIDDSQFCITQNKDAVAIAACSDKDSTTSWTSPESWSVKQAFFADLNRDGRLEVVLLVWRPFKPWPVDSFLPSGGRINAFQDKTGDSCHVILLGWDGVKFKEAWAGSAMADPLQQIYAADLDGDGYDELAALEYPYDGSPNASSLVVWRWNGFGFSLVDREVGRFSSLELFENQGQVLMVTK